MNTRPLMTLEVTVAAPQKVGAVPHGTRATAPITSGHFEGPRLRGTVLPGGGDWTLLRSDGVLELDLRVTLQTDDGALIHMASFGLRHGPPEVIAALARGETVDPSRYYFRTAPRFETSAPKYDFLNRLLAVASGDRRPVGRSTRSSRSSDRMDTRPLMDVHIVAAPAQQLGAGPHGTRLTFPVTGGEFVGDRLRGKVLGGGDWGLVRSDGVLELDLRVTLETDDGALITMTFDGMRHAPPEVIAALGRGEAVDPATYYFRTVPRFATAAPKYAFLNRIVAVGSGENRPDGALHRIEEIL